MEMLIIYKCLNEKIDRKWQYFIGLVGRVFANGPGDLGSIPGCIIAFKNGIFSGLSFNVVISGFLFANNMVIIRYYFLPNSTTLKLCQKKYEYVCIYPTNPPLPDDWIISKPH